MVRSLFGPDVVAIGGKCTWAFGWLRHPALVWAWLAAGRHRSWTSCGRSFGTAPWRSWPTGWGSCSPGPHRPLRGPR
eukprot:11212622-Lingulodinium_polyedra.AAC.1